MMMPMREIFKPGANITFSSDWTVNDTNLLVAIANLLRLRNSLGLPNIHSAICAATINGVKALGIDQITGSIGVGKSADFVILNRDITRISSRLIRKTKIHKTILKGKVVFDASTRKAGINPN
jgi:predicted amidohydrolase YtcJ